MSRLDDWLAEQARAREEAGLTRALATGDRDPTVIDLAGNDYLGLSRDPRVIAEAVRAALTWGAGAGASRLVTGTLPVHDHLETALASFTGSPSALALSTGYHANLAAVAALSDEDTLVISDAHIHASMVDACRLSRGRVEVVPHSNLEAVESALADRSESRALVLAESVYSVLGDAAPVAQLATLCERYDATLVLDEAHALGVAGPGGRGLAHAADLSSATHVVLTVTLSKALGAQGGAVLGSPAVREQLVNRARPFIYDTGLAPASAGAAIAALQVIEKDPALVARVREVATRLAEAAGVEPTAGAVLSVPMPGPREALDAVEIAAKQEVLIGCFRPPSTPDGTSRLRLTAHADLDDAGLDRACSVVREVTGRD